MNTAGGEFSFVVPQNKDLSARVQIDMQLKNMGLPISDDYLYETYGIEKPKNYEELKKAKAAITPDPVKPEDGTEEVKEAGKDDSPEEMVDKKKDKFWKNFFSGLSGFFQDAPKGDKGAALEF